jgi:hypothetical protein
MAGARLTFEERKSILKWYIKFENVAEVQRQWKREFHSLNFTIIITTDISTKFRPNISNIS